jgi:hypothetical protein
MDPCRLAPAKAAGQAALTRLFPREGVRRSGAGRRTSGVRCRRWGLRRFARFAPHGVPQGALPRTRPFRRCWRVWFNSSSYIFGSVIYASHHGLLIPLDIWQIALYPLRFMLVFHANVHWCIVQLQIFISHKDFMVVVMQEMLHTIANWTWTKMGGGFSWGLVIYSLPKVFKSSAYVLFIRLGSIYSCVCVHIWNIKSVGRKRESPSEYFVRCPIFSRVTGAGSSVFYIYNSCIGSP